MIALYNGKPIGQSDIMNIIILYCYYLAQPNDVSDAVVGALPGRIIGEVEKLLAVEFCNGE